MRIRNTRTDETFPYSTLNNAVKSLYGIDGLPLLHNVKLSPSNPYLTKKQATELLTANGYEIVTESKQQQEPKMKTEKKTEMKSETQTTDAMADFTAALSKMIHVEDKIEKSLADKIEGLKSEILDIVNEVAENMKPTAKDIVIMDRVEAPKNIGMQHYNFPDLLLFASQREAVMMVGASGSGKTHGAEQVAEALGLPFYSVSVCSQTTKGDFFGFFNGHGQYVRTLFREAYENGGIFLLDEFDAGNSNVSVVLNQALAQKQCGFADGMIKRHPDFVVIAAANTWGAGASREYVGRNPLDGSTKNRFQFLEWDYDEALEDALCSNKTWLKEVRKVRAIVWDKKIRQIISPRASMVGATMLAAGMSIDRVRKSVLYKDMNESEIKMVA